MKYRTLSDVSCPDCIEALHEETGCDRCGMCWYHCDCEYMEDELDEL